MWKIVISDDNRIATLEEAMGFPQNKVESHLAIIGLLENIKEQHQNKLKCLFNKTTSQSSQGKGLSIVEDKEREDDTEH